MANRLFRIHTEHSRRYQKAVEEIVSLRFDSFNIVLGTGYWKGVRERSMTIEIIGDARDEAKVRVTAKAIQIYNGQEAVYLTITELQTADIIS